ncbi:hypothetical protein ACFVT5_03865 [Streptomyces sp. NPDC058001]|uniref:hypothetical protein n=1 Tax=Streptomyces sp. NPDC058001 TaxID=3346300 RepID=UPI0036ECCAF7
MNDDPGIRFALPPGFTPLPLPLPPAPPEALAHLLDTAPDDTARQRFGAVVTGAGVLLGALCAQGTVHCSLGLHRDDSGIGGAAAPLLSLFTVTWVDTAWAPRAVTAARAVASAEGHTQVEYAELPCGPASLSETVRVTGPRPLLQVHAHVPHPDGTSLAYLTLSTPATPHRPHYRALLRQVAASLRFEDHLTARPTPE